MLIDKEEIIKSLVKAIIALLESIEDNTEMALLIVKYDLEIPILRTYKEAINNPNYSP